jgi:hypothetical protein
LFAQSVSSRKQSVSSRGSGRDEEAESGGGLFGGLFGSGKTVAKTQSGRDKPAARATGRGSGTQVLYLPYIL